MTASTNARRLDGTKRRSQEPNTIGDVFTDAERDLLLKRWLPPEVFEKVMAQREEQPDE